MSKEALSEQLLAGVDLTPFTYWENRNLVGKLATVIAIGNPHNGAAITLAESLEEDRPFTSHDIAELLEGEKIICCGILRPSHPLDLVLELEVGYHPSVYETVTLPEYRVHEDYRYSLKEPLLKAHLPSDSLESFNRQN